jgi:hypothetical protein
MGSQFALYRTTTRIRHTPGLGLVRLPFAMMYLPDVARTVTWYGDLAAQPARGRKGPLTSI